MLTKTSYCAFALLAAFAFQGARPVHADSLSQMISPVTHPTNFEDPRPITEIRPLFVYHEIDDNFATGGGDVEVYAVQARFKIADDWAIIATKDGYVDFNPKGVLTKDKGFANVAAGVKYAAWKTDSSILSLGLRYEAPIGQEKVLQGNGDGIFNPFVSAATVVDGWNLMVGSGFRFRVDRDDSSFYDFDAHVSYKMGNFYPLAEFGLIHVLAAGNRLPIADEGQDYFNIGSSASQGETITTFAVGARYRLSDSVDIGAAYQFPLQREKGTRIIDYRVTADLIYRFSLT
jgi:hypothetical protein